MKSKKSLIIVLAVLLLIIIAISSVIYYYYSQGSKENYVPPEQEKIEAPVAQTEADLKKLSSALETYYAMNFEYPEKLSDMVPDIIDNIPKEPSTEKPYIYKTDFDENFTIAVPKPDNYGLKELRIENGEIIKK